ncbi:hypothetical protein [Kutzneria sp. CA-103260]|uniref:hypothetical protein n=1 Tax=Kutzneria sp. CA-103260 TaxID=2802641 RepID=UPI001BAA3CC8|nr:hypothetical protein [Kutzneria sp. CA-103260]QUQ65925.1 hypothetical protein JJ691_36500 [Kutzneria sp. CA-103260]
MQRRYGSRHVFFAGRSIESNVAFDQRLLDAMRFGSRGDALFSAGVDRGVHYWELDPDRAGPFICQGYCPSGG